MLTRVALLGNHLPLLRELRMPIVTTLHTILAAPDAATGAAGTGCTPTG